MLRHSGRSRKRGGATTVEFAFVAPVLFLVIFGILEYCRFLFVKELLEHACREGARTAAVRTNDRTAGEIRDLVKQRMANFDAKINDARIYVYHSRPLTRDAINKDGVVVHPYNQIFTTAVQPATVEAVAPFTDAGDEDGVTVFFSGTYQPILPRLLLMGTSIPLKANSTMISEAN